MNEQRQQEEQVPIYDAHEPSEASQRVNTMFDDMESKQLDNLNDAEIRSSNASRRFWACCSASDLETRGR